MVDFCRSGLVANILISSDWVGVVKAMPCEFLILLQWGTWMYFIVFTLYKWHKQIVIMQFAPCAVMFTYYAGIMLGASTYIVNSVHTKISTKTLNITFYKHSNMPLGKIYRSSHTYKHHIVCYFIICSSNDHCLFYMWT